MSLVFMWHDVYAHEHTRTQFITIVYDVVHGTRKILCFPFDLFRTTQSYLVLVNIYYLNNRSLSVHFTALL